MLPVAFLSILKVGFVFSISQQSVVLNIFANRKNKKIHTAISFFIIKILKK